MNALQAPASDPQPGSSVVAPVSEGWRRLPQVDGLRGVAICMVLAAHELESSIHARGFLGLCASVGYLGVLLFLMLSGLLITGPLLDEEARKGTVELRKFYARRALRIFPPLVAYIGVMLVLRSFGLTNDFGWDAVLLCLFYLTNISNRSNTFSHTWSLSLQEQFYVLWPPALKWLGRARAFSTACVLVLAINAWRIYSQVHWPGIMVYYRSDYRFDSLLVGFMLAVWLPCLAGEGSGGKGRISTETLVRILSPWWLLPLAIAWTMYSHATQMWYGTLQYPVQTLLSAGILVHVFLAGSSSFNKCLCHPWLQYLGRLSYSLYIWQQIFLLVKVPDWGLIRAPIVDLLPTFACALISYHVIERPFLRWKSAFSA